MKWLIILVFILVGAGRLACAQLQAGDVALIAYNSDTIDSFAWVAFRDIPSNTPIHFTNSSVSNGWFRWGDHLGRAVSPGPLTWNSSSVLKAGTVVSWIAGTQKCWSVGTLSGGGMTLSAEGDQIFAYTGTIICNAAGVAPWLGAPTNAVMLFGLNFANNGWDNINGGGNTSFIPSGLSMASNTAVHAGNSDNGYYSGLISGKPLELRCSIGALSHWTSSNDYINPGLWPIRLCIDLSRGTLISVE